VPLAPGSLEEALDALGEMTAGSASRALSFQVKWAWLSMATTLPVNFVRRLCRAKEALDSNNGTLLSAARKGATGGKPR
jgi:hypothetical protein